MSSVSDTVGYIAERRGAMDYWEQLQSEVVTKCLTPWITEALALPKVGMPIGAFTLVLDGDDIPQKTSQVFEIVKRDAAWQAALDQWYVYRNRTPSWIERRSHACYSFEEFPDIVRDLVENRPGSLIRCNFPTDDLWDAEHVFEENSHWRLASDWQDVWRNHRPKSFQTSPPLPTWLELQEEESYRGTPEWKDTETTASESSQDSLLALLPSSMRL